MSVLNPADYEGVSGVYLVCAPVPYTALTGKRTKQAQHYLGSSPNIAARLREHASGKRGARLLQVMREAGLSFDLVAVWPSTDQEHLEASMKRRHRPATLCPRCRATALAHKATVERERYRGRRAGPVEPPTVEPAERMPWDTGWHDDHDLPF